MSNLSTTSAVLKPVVTVSHNADIVTAIERFDVPFDKQADAIEKATNHIGQHWKTNPEFVGAVLLRSRDRDHGGVSCYTQWKRSADDAAPPTPTPAQSLAAALSDYKLLDSRTYTVEFTDQVQSVAPPTQMSMTQTPNAHFGIFSVSRENQDALLDRARENAPKSLTTPDLGLLAINFHRSIDGLQVINLGVWATLDNFQSLLQRPGFKNDDEYWKGVADFRPDFFDVVAVEVGE